MENVDNFKSGRLSQERRAFLKKSGAITIMSLFGASFFTSCGSDDDSPNGGNTPATPQNGITVNDSSVVIDLSQVPSLSNEGGWILITSARMLVINVGSGFNSLTSVCTHSNCDRNWSLNNNQFVCSCHGSRFTTSGAVVTGPATRPLQSFSNSVSGNTLTINRS
ncbi:ubiquinol-cytochrome c reductase iron-sulfur subunit [Belliella kenyensis]|uniref:Ubiquinol-cytochrome c reductase iron-sulfur subunit n=1 Tax=Belliella kenyensis TaxID=1472724 RepID=A0ABV8EIX8_9BACT|nr:Rieske 2Fe-2S domain-containing protein [Belliella kenyensis]MCH7400358.1 Rieske 2Fe-2S domain-containing protein [Belliella kenyensis]MDN3604624.1 Rieske 2Fe-2S domain-containing protein [Belliella kenyensis]